MDVTRFDDVFDAIATTAAEAASLKARGDVMSAVIDRVKSWEMPQGAAAKRLGITRPRLNDLLRGKIGKFSLDALVDIATAAELEIKLEVRKAA